MIYTRAYVLSSYMLCYVGRKTYPKAREFEKRWLVILMRSLDHQNSNTKAHRTHPLEIVTTLETTTGYHSPSRSLLRMKLIQESESIFARTQSEGKNYDYFSQGQRRCMASGNSRCPFSYSQYIFTRNHRRRCSAVPESPTLSREQSSFPSLRRLWKGSRTYSV